MGSADYSTIVTGMTSAFSDVSSELISAVGQIVPYCVPVMGAVLVVTMGVRVYRRITK